MKTPKGQWFGWTRKNAALTLKRDVGVELPGLSAPVAPHASQHQPNPPPFPRWTQWKYRGPYAWVLLPHCGILVPNNPVNVAGCACPAEAGTPGGGVDPKGVRVHWGAASPWAQPAATLPCGPQQDACQESETGGNRPDHTRSPTVFSCTCSQFWKITSNWVVF